MSPLAYAVALRTLALWTSILAAISPAGFLALMLGDEDFRAGLEKSVEQAKSAIASGLGFTLGLMLALASMGALGVGVMAARAQGDRRRR